MTTSIKTRIIKIGNSRGIRLPKTVIEQLGPEEEVELMVGTGQLVIRSAHRPRTGWARQFRQMAQAGDDKLAE
jgi:antitoxin MazE